MGFSFTDSILELQGELNDLQQASLFGEQNAGESVRLEGRIGELNPEMLYRQVQFMVEQKDGRDKGKRQIIIKLCPEGVSKNG